MYRHLRKTSDTPHLSTSPTDDLSTNRRAESRSSIEYASIPLPQKRSSEMADTARSRIATAGWWWEIGAVIVALICTSLTVAILFYMNGKSLAAWKLPIQPNSLVSVFSSIAKSALLVPVAECLGQLKWTYLDTSESRSLSQVQAFDDASRGPWGAMTLFWKTRKEPTPILALLGASVTILLLAFEPFAQQVIQFSTRNAAMVNATGSAVVVDHLPNVDPKAAMTYANLQFKLGVNGLIDGRSDILRDDGECPTNECRLPDYESLAMCATCQTEELNLDATPEGCLVNLTLAYDNDSIKYGDFRNISWQEFSAHYKNYTASVPAAISEDPGSVNISAKCVLRREDGLPATFTFIKVRDLFYTALDLNEDGLNTTGSFGTTNYTNNPEENTLGSRLNGCISAPRGPWIMAVTRVSLVAPFICIESVSDVTESAVDILKNFDFKVAWCNLDVCAQRYKNVTILNGNLEAMNTISEPLEKLNVSSPAGDYSLRTQAADSPTYTIGNDSTTWYANIVYDFAFDQRGLDDYFLMGADYLGGFQILGKVSTMLMQSRDSHSDLIYGSAYGLETFVRVRWGWFAMPLALEFLATLFLLLTALQSARKSYLFKSSPLALLFHGFEETKSNHQVVKDAQGRGAMTTKTRRDLHKRAEKYQVRLGADNNGDLRIMKVEEDRADQ
ncbi:hypothetical protein K491DRAFT_719390 [Lophiostoma macrostomum CBS 122681]|uniref:Uncharacterized protein n=1 Tax=Lophiostoma macrostomum CBS 122681 TaxID=1314788 RepID=A0A6A6SY10_9PLEO|nr:hypothetical protein K491DRAFT_719390 [Lophiostoma macrostomum CBS 122681]